MKILMVDDEAQVVNFLHEAARVAGYTDVDTAGSGDEALVRVIRGSYDLITLDIRMPGLSGLEILAPIRDMCPHAVIAIVSGHLPKDPAADLDGCADVWISKPVSLERFHRLLEITSRIYKSMQEIRALGDVDLPGRELE